MPTGITNMHEMGMGVTGINPNNGTARNPHNDQHITGGSSSGSAAAVSSGIVPFAIGTGNTNSLTAKRFATVEGSVISCFTLCWALYHDMLCYLFR